MTSEDLGSQIPRRPRGWAEFLQFCHCLRKTCYIQQTMVNCGLIRLWENSGSGGCFGILATLIPTQYNPLLSPQLCVLPTHSDWKELWSLNFDGAEGGEVGLEIQVAMALVWRRGTGMFYVTLDSSWWFTLYSQRDSGAPRWLSCFSNWFLVLAQVKVRLSPRQASCWTWRFLRH